jgi:hypothetical protein
LQIRIHIEFQSGFSEGYIANACSHREVNMETLLATLLYSVSTLNSDKLSTIWDEMRIKFGCSENRVWIKWGQNWVEMRMRFKDDEKGIWTRLN